MIMTEMEIQKIIKAADFFDNKGYTRDIDDATISYSNGGIDIIIFLSKPVMLAT